MTAATCACCGAVFAPRQRYCSTKCAKHYESERSKGRREYFREYNRNMTEEQRERRRARDRNREAKRRRPSRPEAAWLSGVRKLFGGQLPDAELMALIREQRELRLRLRADGVYTNV